MQSRHQQLPEMPISGVRPAVSWLPPRRVFQKMCDEGGLPGAGRSHHDHKPQPPLLSPKLVEAAEEQDHKTAQRHADLLPALKGGVLFGQGGTLARPSRAPRAGVKELPGPAPRVIHLQQGLLQKRLSLKTSRPEGRDFRLL